ncbi:MAG: 4-hydroxy-tetrahydrodipicolinate synthase [Saprospiraceae bacterium]|jgi:4-hydroxy-tetrahydrodipicolinate synthase|tara:strand:- start:2448 stop:3350 length:903 start_codon:yes stop_codon:yes gene_type:complete
MVQQSQFTGTGVAMITPFKNNEVDYPTIERIIEHLIDGGINYLVALGSTGETATLNEEESRKVLDTVISVVNKRIPIVAGNFGGNNTLELCKKIKSYDFKGLDAILSSSPAYVKPSQEGIYHHYMEMAKASEVPIILYNVPGRTKSNMEWTTTIRLAEASKKFIGIKEATGDLIQATRIIKNRPDNFFVTSGDDEVALPMVACGGEGVISVIGNAFPKEFSGMINAALKNNYPEARRLNLQTYDLHKWLYIEGNPVGIKSAMKILGFGTNDVRLPLHNMSESNYTQLEKALRKVMQTIAE